MNTFEKFNKDMDWTMFEGTQEQHKKIYNSVQAVESIKALEYDLDISLESDNVTSFVDVNLESVISYFSEYDLDTIIEMIFNRYGNCIDLYYAKAEETYVLIFETR